LLSKEKWEMGRLAIAEGEPSRVWGGGYPGEYPEYPLGFSYVWETKGLRAKALYEGETKELGGVSGSKSEGEAKRGGEMVKKAGGKK
jgi:hypothetical protein